MFSKADGPTALHADLVRGLSFSRRQADADTPEGPEPALAALAAVWNGEKGFVAVVVRFLKRPRAERFVYSESIASEAQFHAATAEGVEFAEGLGFEMDPVEFASLPAGAKAKRLKAWNKLRKVRARRRSAGTGSDPQLEPAADPEGEPPVRAVLGKIALERRRNGGPWTNPSERLLAFF